jgi:2-dehydropantoate 2-reductase
MKIGIVGGGGIGSHYAGILSKAGHEVRLLARGDHLAAIRKDGLHLRTPEGQIDVRPSATDDGRVLEDSEYVLVAVKSYSLKEIAPVLAACGRRGATIVPLLNGVDIAERLEQLGVPISAILGGLAAISVVRTAPGIVERRSPFDRVVVGELGGGLSDRATRLADTLRAAGSDARASSEMPLELWRKFVFIVPMTVACGLSRRTAGAVFATEAGRDLAARAVREIVAVSRAVGVSLSDRDEANTIDALHKLPPAMKPSFLLDLERGGANELDVLAGTVHRLGRMHGVPTPVHDVATAAFTVASTP